MATETLTPAPVYIIAGVGPYAVPHAWRASADLVVVVRSPATGGAIPLVPGPDFTATPAVGAGNAGGSVTLAAGTATAYAGWRLEITRTTRLEQGWVGSTARETGLERQLDCIVMALQDRGAELGRAFKAPPGVAFDVTIMPPAAGRTIIVNPAGSGFVAGPSADQIAGAQGAAASAQAILDQVTAAASGVGLRKFTVTTETAIATTTVPATAQAIETLGQTASGDGQNKLFQRYAANPGGAIQSADGAWWRAVGVAPPYLAMTSRIIQDVVAGLPLSPLHFGAVGRADAAYSAADTAGLQAMVDFAINATGLQEVHTLDFCGRRFVIDQPITDLASPAGSGIYNKRLCNGYVAASSSFPLGTGADAGTYLFDLTRRTDGNLNNVRFDAMTFSGLHSGAAPYRADGAIKVDRPQGVWISDCDFQRFERRHFWSVHTGAASEIFIDRSRFSCGGRPNSRAIDLDGNDSRVSNCLIRDFGIEGVRFRKGSNAIAGCHLYNYVSDACAGIICETASTCQIHDNYIDGVWIDVFNPNGCSIIGNYMLLQDGARWKTLGANPDTDRAFVEILATAMAQGVVGLKVWGNTARCQTGGNVNLVRYRPSAGVSIGNFQGSFIGNNSGRFVNLQQTHPRASVSITAATTGAIDFSAYAIGGQTFERVTATLQGTGGPITNVGRSGNTFTANLGAAGTGYVNMQANLNADGA